MRQTRFLSLLGQLGNQEEPRPPKAGCSRRRQSEAMKSRMTRECHVRICERLEVKLLRPTRQYRMLRHQPTEVTGIMSMVSKKRAGLHPRCGTIYHWGLAVLVISAGCLAAAQWRDDRVLLVLGFGSFGASCLGRVAEDETGRPGSALTSFLWVALSLLCSRLSASRKERAYPV